MTETDIANALREHLTGTVSRPTNIVMENDPTVFSAPFWLAYQVKTPPERVGLGAAHMLRGRFMVAVMVEEGAFTGEAEQSAELVIARFPERLRLPAGDGFVTVSHRPHQDEGYNDGAYYRVNVTVRWEAVI